MDGYHFYSDPEKTSWPVALASLWLRLGFVAVTGAVVALTELYKGEIGILAALAWIFGGTWVAVQSWRRGKALLDRSDDDVSEAVRPAAVRMATTHPGWDRREVGPQLRG